MIKVVNGVEVTLNSNEVTEFNAQTASLREHLVRSERDALLKQSDVYALSDRITDEWIAYRQELRNVPAQSGFPTSVTWPTKP
jgi:hypothetical protein